MAVKSLSRAKGWGTVQAETCRVEQQLTDLFIAHQLPAIKLAFHVSVRNLLWLSPCNCSSSICLMRLALFMPAAVAPAQPPRMTGGVRQGAQGGSRLIRVPAAAHP
jgi:hypothetical protein